MPADTDIGNMALSRLGTRATIADLTENSTEARQINLWYATVRDELQSLVDWNFNRVTQALAASGTPPARWASSYAYPSDCLRMRRLEFGASTWLWGEPARGFEIASNGSATFLYCNEDRVTAVFAQRVVDPARFTPGFTLAFVDCLAAAIAHAITQKADLAERLARRAQDRIERAVADSANEGLIAGDADRMVQSVAVRGFDGSAP
ncbi:hypothetical protein [Reyranella sp.]|jgi:hypothetical protein|uniref:hypothetical protein n=1 Tax=Reyranella sp. TaxID=1929291 RepID=UPI000BCFF1A0|nr:hypothetical protein [Reyranella sp.]OYY37272.1 MAG: hypothetical protein B7Y57_23765 [Rhodospirillales bacterium 35-66-84]OYZ94244.1 MAG: hypothetical protein B7Y08_14000 [Rhodospirillales bacterium 24-66-33]OZB23083.1 MAG: hypothetical protein B7X63_21145 [Rhodospirillales bacterium 39-66-50]HQS17263.1 hypothetical protein [Reyranella sp.]HQT13666.1 hypothetical protein [Reyranella sp.]